MPKRIEKSWLRNCPCEQTQTNFIAVSDS